MHIGLAMGTSLRCTSVELWVPGTSVGKCTLVEQRTPLELSGQGPRETSIAMHVGRAMGAMGPQRAMHVVRQSARFPCCKAQGSRNHQGGTDAPHGG